MKKVLVGRDGCPVPVMEVLKEVQGMVSCSSMPDKVLNVWAASRDYVSLPRVRKGAIEPEGQRDQRMRVKSAYLMSLLGLKELVTSTGKPGATEMVKKIDGLKEILK